MHVKFYENPPLHKGIVALNWKDIINQLFIKINHRPSIYLPCRTYILFCGRAKHIYDPPPYFLYIKIYFFHLPFVQDQKISFYFMYCSKRYQASLHWQIKSIFCCKLALYTPSTHAKFQGSSFFNNEMGSNSKNIHRILGHPVELNFIIAKNNNLGHLCT